MSKSGKVLVMEFPIQLNRLYSSERKIDRVEFMLEFYSSLSSFFNEMVAGVLANIVDDGDLITYEGGVNDDDDILINRRLYRVFRDNVDRREFGRDMLDRMVLTAEDIRAAMKLLTYDLIEVCLNEVVDNVHSKAVEEGMTISSVDALSSTRELYGYEGYPTTFIIEATITLGNMLLVE